MFKITYHTSRDGKKQYTIASNGKIVIITKNLMIVRSYIDLNKKGGD